MNFYASNCYEAMRQCQEEVDLIPCEDCKEVWRRAEQWMRFHSEAQNEVSRNSHNHSPSARAEIRVAMDALANELCAYFDRYGCGRPTL